MERKKAKSTATADLDAMIVEDSLSVEVGPDKLAQITTTAADLVEQQKRVTVLEARLEEANAEVKRLAEQVLPTLMDEAGVQSLGLEGGDTLKREEAVFASMSKANAPMACDWLEENGYGALVKTSIVIPLDKGDTKTRKKVLALLTKARVGFDETMGVHPGTLTAFVKESLAEGRELPKSITYHVQPRVVIKHPKVRK